MITKEKARSLRALIEKASAGLTDEEALEGVELFPAWEAETEYDAGTRVRYGGKLYRCEQSHTSQSDWTPDVTPAMWTEVAKPGEIPVWRQPTGAQDAYRIGELVHYPDEDGPVYENDVDYNIYAPDVYGWHLKEE